MAPSIGSSWRSFWHTMTSYDRHASHDSPYRTGQHVALPQSRHSPLTGIATSAMDSRPELARAQSASEEFVNGNRSNSPHSPYKPGLRSSLQRASSDTASEIQMQSFSNGLPPAPPVSHSWKRIDRWAEDTYAELYDELQEGCTQNDINELEHELDCTLPLDVRESLQIHDGQERGGLPTGIIFGCMLLDCEEIVQEWRNWQKVGQEYLSPASSKRNSVASNGVNGSIISTSDAISPLGSPTLNGIPQPVPKAFGSAPSIASSSASVPPPLQSPSQNPAWRSELMARQTSHPPNFIQHAYTQPSWIPLARDWGGNCIAVDLAPGPNGKWGQIIVFGRDYDCKFVAARSWAHFLAQVADDFAAGDFKLEDGEGVEGRGNGGKVYVDDETGELRFREFWARQPGVDVSYMEVLRWRCDRKYGRRVPPGGRRSLPGAPNGKATGLRINPGVGGPPPRTFGSSNDSPYASPSSSTPDLTFNDRSERGRSPHRATGKQPLVSSPLARVAEEPGMGHVLSSGPSPPPSLRDRRSISIKTDLPPVSLKRGSSDKLVSVETPRASDDLIHGGVSNRTSVATTEVDNDATPTVAGQKLGRDGLIATPVVEQAPVMAMPMPLGERKENIPTATPGAKANGNAKQISHKALADEDGMSTVEI